MRQSLNINLGQKLKLTPKLQNAIRLLQLSTTELSIEIQNALDSNPFLELAEEQQEAVLEDGQPEAIEEALQPLDLQNSRDDFVSEFEDGISVAETERDTISSEQHRDNYATTSNITTQDTSHLIENAAQTENLSDHLRDQVHQSRNPGRIQKICEVLIDNLDERGYLDLTEAELKEHLETFNFRDQDEIYQAIELLQSLEPAGIGARDLRECLLIQLKANRNTLTEYQHAVEILQNNFELLIQRNLALLSKQTKLAHSEIAKALLVIQKLTPRPAENFTTTNVPYIIPDLIVSKFKNNWEVRLGTQERNQIKLSPASESYLQATVKPEDSLYFKERYQEAKWLLQSLQQRRDTILKVGEEIVRHQRAFFEHGEGQMQPLTLKQVANALDLHESTVSRTTTRKYISSPHGIHELKYFFSTALESDSGESHSAISIQSKIKQLITKEPEHKPISDQKLADHFRQEGLVVARRTIAKYREQMNIPPSSQRKAFFKP